jgi:Family of unknown function (DUF5681)
VSTKDKPVGYSSPPIHSQYKPGQSGNPSGRPTKTVKLNDVLTKEANAKMTVPIDGSLQQVTKLELLAKSILGNGIKGDMKAAALFLRHWDQAQAEADEFWQEYHRKHTTEAVVTAKAIIDKWIPNIAPPDDAEFKKETEYWELWRQADEQGEDFPPYEEWKKMNASGDELE